MEVQNYPILGYASTGLLVDYRRGQVSKRYVPLVVGALSTISALWVMIAFEGWWRFLIAVPLLAFGWPSIKTAFQASDAELDELTGDSELSKETAEKLKDRL